MRQFNGIHNYNAGYIASPRVDTALFIIFIIPSDTTQVKNKNESTLNNSVLSFISSFLLDKIKYNDLFIKNKLGKIVI